MFSKRRGRKRTDERLKNRSSDSPCQQHHERIQTRGSETTVLGLEVEDHQNMENGKLEDGGDDTYSIDLLQFQAMWLELKSGFGGMAQDVAMLQQKYSRMEETVTTYQQETSDNILSLRNTLNTLQEDVSNALTQLHEIKSNQKDLQRDFDRVQITHHRKWSRGEGSVDGHASLSSQTDLTLIQHYINSLSANQSSHEHDSAGPKKSPVWRERKNSRDLTEQNSSTLTVRQTAALELLESERLYVSDLSLLLKANISFNNSENINLKDKRLFPSSLRFLIQQHLELLHLLQERVLRSHWRSVMGDVFLRLTSKGSDFLDHYVSYLRELPECLTVLSLFSSKAGLLESDITGDETRHSLYSLLLQPVQRIPEYLTLLQGLLHQTESEHPDYYLLLVCVQQLRSFTTHYSHLLQHNQNLLTHSRVLREHTHIPCAHQQERPTHTRNDPGRSGVRQLYKVDYEKHQSSAQTDSSQGLRRNKRYHDYEALPYHYDADIPSPASRIPEADRAGSGFPGALLPYGTGDRRCSSPSHSSDSSVDIAFVRFGSSHIPPHQSHSKGRKTGGVVYRPRVSPDTEDILRPRPLQAAQRKSKSLNGLQMDSIDSHAHRMKPFVHPRLERQSSAKLRPRPSSPKHRHETHTDTEEPQPIHQKNSRSLVWEDLKLKGVSNDYGHTPLSEHNRKEGKGFRSSFKKLFKKKSTDAKEKTTLIAEGSNSEDMESNRATHTEDINKGTAV